MGSKKYKDKHKEKKKYEKGKNKKVKKECCDKYIKKGKHCKGCPLRGECELPEK